MKETKITVPVDAAFKILKKNVDWCKQPAYVCAMPDQPDPDKRVLSVRVSRELYRKLQKDAKACRQPFNEYIRGILLVKTDHVALTKADYEQILKEREEHVAKTAKKKK